MVTDVSFTSARAPLPAADMCHPVMVMRDADIIETELMEISAIADDTLRFERTIVWCASNPDDVPFALHQFISRRDKPAPPTSDSLPESGRQ
jgi:hypothetical protein